MAKRYQLRNTYVIAGLATLGGMMQGFDVSSMSAIIGTKQYKAYFHHPGSVLVAVAPELKSLLDEHLEGQEGELLPYLFMGDVAAWLDTESRVQPQRVVAIAEWLEREFVAGDFDVRNLIAVGMVEMLPAKPEGTAVLDLLGPELRARAEVAGLLG